MPFVVLCPAAQCPCTVQQAEARSKTTELVPLEPAAADPLSRKCLTCCSRNCACAGFQLQLQLRLLPWGLFKPCPASLVSCFDSLIQRHQLLKAAAQQPDSCCLAHVLAALLVVYARTPMVPSRTRLCSHVAVAAPALGCFASSASSRLWKGPA